MGPRLLPSLDIFYSVLRRRFINPVHALLKNLSDGIAMMHKGKADGVCYRLQMVRVLGCYILKRSHFGRHMHGYLDTDHSLANHGMSTIKVGNQMH